MTGRRNTIIAISTIVVFAAMVGFFITLDVSPQIAYARLFIDAGLVIGLIAAVMAFYKEKELPTQTIITAIRQIKSGKFNTRVSAENLGHLQEIAENLNDLAQSLEQDHEKQEEIKRSLREELLPGLKQKETLQFEHSYHPELGPVVRAPSLPPSLKNSHAEILNTSIPIAMAPRQPNSVETLKNALVDSKPPSKEKTQPPAMADQRQDLGDLYQRFIEAQQAASLTQIEYPTFLKTIEQTTQDLISTYHCQGVWFDIVSNHDQIALQPRIIR